MLIQSKDDQFYLTTQRYRKKYLQKENSKAERDRGGMGGAQKKE